MRFRPKIVIAALALLLGVTGLSGATHATAIDAYAYKDLARGCDPTLKPGVVAFRQLLLQQHPLTVAHNPTYDMLRACNLGGPSEHKEGRAWDWTVNFYDVAQRYEAYNAFHFLLDTDAEGNKYAMARRLGVMYIIFDHKIILLYSQADADVGWRNYPGADPHTSHVHFSFSRAGAAKQTSFWNGYAPFAQRAGDFVPFPGFTGEANIASCQLDANPDREIVYGAGAGHSPEVVVTHADGSVISRFLAYYPGFMGGVDVACGDLDGNGVQEIITGAGPGGGPHVRAFNAAGVQFANTSFYAYDPGYSGGIRVAAGDFDGDGVDEILTGTGFGHSPELRVFRADGTITQTMFPFNPGYVAGVDVAAGDLNGDGVAEAVVSTVRDWDEIQVFSMQHDDLESDFTPTKVSYGIEPFPGNHTGLHISVGDVNNDGFPEIMAAAVNNAAPRARFLDIHGQSRGDTGDLLEATYTGGIDVAAGKGAASIVTQSWQSASPLGRRII